MAAKIGEIYDCAIEDRLGLRHVVHEAGLKQGIPEDVLNLLDAVVFQGFVAANDKIKAEFRMMQLAAQKRVEDLREEQMQAELARRDKIYEKK